ncbi:MAG: site-2 protease family protein [Candidatus Hydrogenedentes bacterium]|nr:site-2 protease family protein [Candidatus Hydrogenedentota bacterium]
MLFALCIHEASHAAMANWCGDPSARLLGRMTLNPLAHVDPIGTVVMPLLMMTSGSPFLIGWAKPVPVNPLNLRNMRRDQVLVALAGPGANLTAAIVCAVILRIGTIVGGVTTDQELFASPVLSMFLQLAVINVALLAFNLIPIPPLDGSWVLHYFLPPSGQQVLERIGPFGILLIILFGRSLIAIPFKLLLSLILLIAF